MRKVIAGLALAGTVGIAGILMAAEWDGTETSAVIHEKKVVESTNLKRNAAIELEKANPLDLSSQKDIQERLMNSYHFYEKVMGSFRYQSSDAGFDYTVDYQLKWKDQKVQYHVKTMENNKQASIELSYADGQSTIVYPESKIYEQSKLEIKDKGKFRRAEDAVVKNSDGSKDYMYPETSLNLGLAENSLHSKEIAVGFLEDYALWKVRGTEEFLGRETVVIDGSFASFYQKKLKANTFTLWMDRNTGILLKYETYADGGEVIDSLVTNDFKIQEDFEVDDASKLITKEYKKYEPVRKK